MQASSHIILDKELLRNNWEFLHSYFAGKKISAVVKGNAYGHGIEDYVPMAEACGATWTIRRYRSNGMQSHVFAWT